MIVDARLTFKDNLDLAVGGLFAGIAALTDVIDLGPAVGRGINGQGGANSAPRGPMVIRFVARGAAVGAGAAGVGNMQPTLVTGDTLDAGGASTGLAVGGTVLAAGFPYSAFQFAAGKLLGEMVLPPKMEMARYLQVIWLASNSGFTSGAVDVFMVADSSNPDIYPNGTP